MKIFFWVLIVVALLTLGAWLYLLQTPPPEVRTLEPTVKGNVLLTAQPTDPFKGERSAPVTVILVSSFGCPACKEAAVVSDQLLASFPNEVKIVRKDLPESTGASYFAAIAARCAQQQGRFWQYHDILFGRQEDLSNFLLYSAWARELGLDMERFDACFDGQQTKELVDANIREGLAAKLDSVPYFQINESGGFSGSATLGTLREMVQLELNDSP